MNSILNDSILIDNLSYNLNLLKHRFSDLYGLLGFNLRSCSSLLHLIPKDYSLIPSLKEDALTLKIKDKFIHSKYSPTAEANKAYSFLVESSKNVKDFCFFGLGLGYLSETFIKNNAGVKIVLIEPDIFIFILFLASRRLDAIFSHNQLIIIPATPAREALNILENLSININNSTYFKASLDVSVGWIEEFNAIRLRQNKKHALNCNTLKKFYVRWLKNFIKNIDLMIRLTGVSFLKNVFLNLPCIIFAAGPSLDEHVEKLKGAEDFFITIAVDTSLASLLDRGLIPDFVILMDGQYLNYLHIAQCTVS